MACDYNAFSQTVDQLTGVGADDFWNHNVDFSVEDAWRATPKLPLSLGMQYDVQLVPGPDMPDTANPAAFHDTSQINPDLHMIQPRFGLNYNRCRVWRFAGSTDFSTGRFRTRRFPRYGVRTACTRSSTAHQCVDGEHS